RKEDGEGNEEENHDRCGPEHPLRDLGDLRGRGSFSARRGRHGASLGFPGRPHNEGRPAAPDAMAPGPRRLLRQKWSQFTKNCDHCRPSTADATGRRAGQPRTDTPSVASTPNPTPQMMIEMVCQRMTAFFEAPNDTIAAEVIWLGRRVWPRRLTPATPYLSKRSRSFARRAVSGLASLPPRTFDRTPCALSTKMSIDTTFPTMAARIATTGLMPAR